MLIVKLSNSDHNTKRGIKGNKYLQINEVFIDPIALKVIFDKMNGKIFGAQAVGEVRVEKRIDVVNLVVLG